MATVKPFRAIRPTVEAAAGFASLPYDVMDVTEARAMVAKQPQRFFAGNPRGSGSSTGNRPACDSCVRTGAEETGGIYGQRDFVAGRGGMLLCVPPADG